MRRFADDVFLAAMAAANVARWKRWLIYRAVRLGGRGPFYGRDEHLFARESSMAEQPSARRTEAPEKLWLAEFSEDHIEGTAYLALTHKQEVTGIPTSAATSQIATNASRDEPPAFVEELYETTALQWHLMHRAGGKTLNAILRTIIANARKSNHGCGNNQGKAANKTRSSQQTARGRQWSPATDCRRDGLI